MEIVFFAFENVNFVIQLNVVKCRARLTFMWLSVDSSCLQQVSVLFCAQGGQIP